MFLEPFDVKKALTTLELQSQEMLAALEKAGFI